MGYTVRYEQGHFQSGFCRVEDRKVLVINKFFDLEGRMNCLMEILQELPYSPENMEEEDKKLYEKAISMRSLQESEA